MNSHEQDPSQISQLKDLNDNINGYDQIETGPGGEILCLKSSKGEKPEIRVGAQVTMVGDSHGYAGGLKPGEKVEILRIEMPFQKGRSYDILLVKTKDGEVAAVKPKEVR